MAQRLDRLVSLLDGASGGETVVTSLRQPAGLRAALKLAVEMGMDSTVNDATNRAAFARLENFVQVTALEAHFRAHPRARPSLAEVAVALARLEDNPLAARPEIIEQAATEVLAHRPDADADDVLLWAMSLLEHGWGDQAVHMRRKPRPCTNS